MIEFEEIYRRYFGDVYRYALKLSGSERDAEEITSDTFFKALRSLDGFRGDCELRVWLCRIAKNCFYDRLKKSDRTETLDDALPLSVDGPEAQVLLHDGAERARTVLHGIAEPYREVFMWRGFAELSFKQIGTIFGKSENWACVTYHRAKSLIRSKLEENEHEK